MYIYIYITIAGYAILRYIHVYVTQAKCMYYVYINIVLASYYSNIYIYIYVCMYVCVCNSVYLCERFLGKRDLYANYNLFIIIQFKWDQPSNPKVAGHNTAS